MTATATRRVIAGGAEDETEIFVPAIALGSVGVSGAAALDRIVTNPDGTRTVLVAPTGAGPYTSTDTVAAAAAQGQRRAMALSACDLERLREGQADFFGLAPHTIAR